MSITPLFSPTSMPLLFLSISAPAPSLCFCCMPVHLPLSYKSLSLLSFHLMLLLMGCVSTLSPRVPCLPLPASYACSSLSLFAPSLLPTLWGGGPFFPSGNPPPHRTVLKFYPPALPLTILFSFNNLCYTFLSPKNFFSPNPPLAVPAQAACCYCFSSPSPSLLWAQCLRRQSPAPWRTTPTPPPCLPRPGNVFTMLSYILLIL